MGDEIAGHYNDTAGDETARTNTGVKRGAEALIYSTYLHLGTCHSLGLSYFP